MIAEAHLFCKSLIKILMKIRLQTTAISLFLSGACLISACSNAETVPTANSVITPSPVLVPTVIPSLAAAKIPNLQAEILDERDTKTDSPLGKFDFKNYAYPLPHGWEDADGKDAVLENGKRLMSETERKIGVSYVTTKFFDATGDGQDEAFVILKIDTAGSAVPQMVYVFQWKNDKPELVWHFRTGDRADGGLKNLQAENGELVIELFGQDRFILGELETSKITNDLEQICCPTFFTRIKYKWNGSAFRMDGKRLTFSTADKNAAPIENMVEIAEPGPARPRKR